MSNPNPGNQPPAVVPIPSGSYGTAAYNLRAPTNSAYALNTTGSTTKGFNDLTPAELMESLVNSITRLLDDKVAEAQMLWEEEQDDGSLGELVAIKRMKTDLLAELENYPNRIFSIPQHLTSAYLASRMYNYP